MGGFGSGRASGKQKAEHSRALNITALHRSGCLAVGWSGGWSWTRDGKEEARISFKAEQGRVVLDYKVRLYSGEWEPITQPVPITHVDCHYGGQRPYFLCPGVVNDRHCGRRVGKLFLGGRYFLCRHCHNISYSSQSEAHYGRMLRRANKLRMSLGGDPGTVQLIAFKPKGMWQRTYDRKRFEIQRCERQATQLFLRKFAHLLSAEDRQMFFDE
ncbi:MAG: hypothetical protein ABJR46_13210 [Tateyamaria sp.]|uniref:hypothetical protein n=1 Tax=Tateyamaria sp. TaxID=1929288 RepID=UPI00329E8F7D